MTVKIVSKNPLVKKIVDGGATPDLIDMLLNKTLPFTEEEYLECFVLILKEEAHKSQAISRLKEIGDSVKTTYITKSEANHRVAYFVLIEALSRNELSIVAKTIQNQALPYEFLLKIAEKGSIEMLEMLLENQIKMIAYPEVMTVIEKNPAVNNFILGKIKEIREFYLEKSEVTEIPLDSVIENIKEAVLQENEAEKGEAKDSNEVPQDALLDPNLEQKAMTVLQEINAMSLSQRIKLALTGNRTQRAILVKDSNKMVALAVLESPKISIDEIELLTKDKSIPGDIISKIANHREWTKNYNIMIELLQNPKTPINYALGFIKKLHMRELEQLSRNKNINPVIKNLAMANLQARMKKE